MPASKRFYDAIMAVLGHAEGLVAEKSRREFEPVRVEAFI